jgi:hypothetical protein
VREFARKFLARVISAPLVCRFEQREHLDSRFLSQPEKRRLDTRNLRANRGVRRISTSHAAKWPLPNILG